MTTYLRFATPLGEMIAIASGDRITNLDFSNSKYAPEVRGDWREDPRSPLLARCAREVA
jgi:hypothetical protein